MGALIPWGNCLLPWNCYGFRVMWSSTGGPTENHQDFSYQRDSNGERGFLCFGFAKKIQLLYSKQCSFSLSCILTIYMCNFKDILKSIWIKLCYNFGIYLVVTHFCSFRILWHKVANQINGFIGLISVNQLVNQEISERAKILSESGSSPQTQVTFIYK